MQSGQPYILADLLKIMERLRSECPWDKKQTHESLKPYLLEESYEVLETIDERQWHLLAAELGDLLLQIIFHSQIASEKGLFDFGDVISLISQKLVDRHPHVFGEQKTHSADEVQANWEHSKIENEKRASLLSGIPRSAPALLQAQRLQQKAATVGFEWTHINDVIAKADEEWNEFKEALQEDDQEAVADEFGDFLFSLVNVNRYLDVNTEDALRRTNRKFIHRFQYIEKQYHGNVKAMKNASLAELDNHWNDAKHASE